MERRRRPITPRRPEIVLLKFDGPGAAPCPTCAEPLLLSQPDNDNPNRLVATCSACGAWYLLVNSTHGGAPAARAFSLAAAFRSLERADRENSLPLNGTE